MWARRGLEAANYGSADLYERAHQRVDGLVAVGHAEGYGEVRSAQRAVGGPADSQMPQRRGYQRDAHVGGDEGDEGGAVGDDVFDARDEADRLAGGLHQQVHVRGRVVVVGDERLVAQVGQVEFSVDGRWVAAGEQHDHRLVAQDLDSEASGGDGRPQDTDGEPPVE